MAETKDVKPEIDNSDIIYDDFIFEDEFYEYDYDDLEPVHQLRFSINRLGFGLILLGLCLFALGWRLGSRGGIVYFDSGFSLVADPFNDGLGGSLDFVAPDIHTIYIDVIDNAIRLVPTIGTEVHVIAAGRNQPVASAESGVLNISTPATGISNMQLSAFGPFGTYFGRSDTRSYMHFNFNPSDLSVGGAVNMVSVYVPTDVQVINVASSSGNVRMENINTDGLTIHSVSGNIAVIGGTHKHVDIFSASGRINVADIRSTELVMHANTSNMRIEGGSHEDVRLTSVSGAIRGSGFFGNDIYAHSTSGRIDLTDSNAQRTNAANINLQSTTGHVRFYTRAPYSNFTYTFAISSGNIRIDGNRISANNASGGSGNTLINASSTSGGVRVGFSR